MTKILSLQDAKRAKAFAKDQEYVRDLRECVDFLEHVIKYEPNQSLVAEADAKLGEARELLDIYMKRVRVHELIVRSKQVATLVALHGTDEQIARADEIFALLEESEKREPENQQELLQDLNTHVLLYTEYNKLAE